MENKVYKRTSRHPSSETKQKISQSLRGREKNDVVRKNIANGLSRYWQNDANFPDDARHEGTGNGWIETGDVV